MRKLGFILFIFIFIFISCASDECEEEYCKGEEKLVSCKNTKPEFSLWSTENPNGKLIQTYNGDKFVPDVNSCKWDCDYGFEKKDGKCVTKLNIDDSDNDNDGIINDNDNCINIANPEQKDLDNDFKGDKCDEDIDNDGIINEEDNCIYISNFNQDDLDNDSKGDKCDEDIDNDGVVNGEDKCPLDDNDSCIERAGTYEEPFIIKNFTKIYKDSRNTKNSTSSIIDKYLPNELNESGKEYFYKFTIDEAMRIEASIDDPEPEGVDIDLHILKSIEPLVLLDRGHHKVDFTLMPGTYYLVLDSFTNKAGEKKEGNYNLEVKFYGSNLGTLGDNIELIIDEYPFYYKEKRDTRDAMSDYFSSYLPNKLDMSGKEYVYHFTLSEKSRFMATINEDYENDNVDIDLQLIKKLDKNNPELVARSDNSINKILPEGEYYLVLDSFYKDNAKEGIYELNINVNSINFDNDFFNEYILKAVDYLYANYRLRGYASANLTHDIEYGVKGVNDSLHYGIIKSSGGEKTMCVSAVMEVILTAMRIYVEETGDNSIYNFLPKKSFERQDENNIKGHIWVHPDYSRGTGDALNHFGLGDNYHFTELKPGSFVNLNRYSGTGHAVTFLAFLDKKGNEYDVYPEGIEIIGFKYFSSQGRYAVGEGGFDYRWAVFGNTDSTAKPEFCNIKKCDRNVIKRLDSQKYFNTGMMWAPSKWVHKAQSKNFKGEKIYFEEEDGLPLSDPSEWNGLTSYELENE